MKRNFFLKLLLVLGVFITFALSAMYIFYAISDLYIQFNNDKNEFEKVLADYTQAGYDTTILTEDWQVYLKETNIYPAWSISWDFPNHQIPTPFRNNLTKIIDTTAEHMNDQLKSFNNYYTIFTSLRIDLPANIKQDTTIRMKECHDSLILWVQGQSYINFTKDWLFCSGEITTILRNQSNYLQNLAKVQKKDISKLKNVLQIYRINPTNLENRLTKLNNTKFKTNSQPISLAHLQNLENNYTKYHQLFLDYKKLAGNKKLTKGKRILVNISKQHMYMIEEGRIVKHFAASTGIGNSTRYGTFTVFEKVDMAWGVYNIWMPYWLSIYNVGSVVNGFHGIPLSPNGVKWTSWEKVVGRTTITYGCIMPIDSNAKILYYWADVGTKVDII